MLETVAVDRLAADVARSRAMNAQFERVLSRPVIDSEGNPALQITLVLSPASVREISGDEALDVLVGIQRKLLEAGEERLAIVEYATEAELADDQEDEEDDRGEEDA